jgi:hypothetical protein
LELRKGSTSPEGAIEGPQVFALKGAKMEAASIIIVVGYSLVLTGHIVLMLLGN